MENGAGPPAEPTRISDRGKQDILLTLRVPHDSIGGLIHLMYLLAEGYRVPKFVREALLAKAGVLQKYLKKEAESG